MACQAIGSQTLIVVLIGHAVDGHRAVVAGTMPCTAAGPARDRTLGRIKRIEHAIACVGFMPMPVSATSSTQTARAPRRLAVAAAVSVFGRHHRRANGDHAGRAAACVHGVGGILMRFNTI
jgi:hypothetical protein